MKRRNFNKKEQDILQKLQRENEKLRRTIQSLRKQMSRIDIDEYQNLREIIESQETFDSETERKNELKKLKERWLCRVCSTDYLRLVMVPRLDGVFYFRRCANCGNKTKLKKYTEEVEGIDSDDKIHKKGF